MANNKKIQSVEPNIADLVNGWLKSYNVDYKLEQESLNPEIDKALDEYYSKNGGVGGNRPDAKALLKDKYSRYYPVLIEYKGYKDKLVKLNPEGQVKNKSAKGDVNPKVYTKFNINFSVNEFGIQPNSFLLVFKTLFYCCNSQCC